MPRAGEHRGVGADPRPGRHGAADAPRNLRVRHLYSGAGGRRFPYRRAHHLLQWACSWRQLVEARLAGRDAESVKEVLDAAYAIQVELLTAQVGGGGSLGDALARFEDALREPLPGELSADEVELRRRNRIALENQAALQRLMQVSQLPTAGGA